MDFEPRTFVTAGGHEVRVRKACPADAPQLYTFLNGLGIQSSAWFSPHPFDLDHVRSMVRDEHARSLRIIALEGSGADEILVGQASFRYRDTEPSYPTVGIAVADSMQNQKLGRELMRLLGVYAERAGYPGLGLSVYKDNLRATHLYATLGYRFSGETDDGQQWKMQLDFDTREALEYRGMYIHPIPYGLRHLTADTFTPDEWKECIRLLQAAGANVLKVYLWPQQYYVPWQQDTHTNRIRYEILKDALSYARLMGLKVLLGYSYNLAPPPLWYTHAEWRAPGPQYPGITFCWDKAESLLMRYAEHNFEYFADAVDGYMLWFHDPGFCRCSSCNPFERTAPKVISRYRQLLRPGQELLLSMWQVEEQSHGDQGFAASPKVVDVMLDECAPGSLISVPAVGSTTWHKALERGLKPLHFGFFLDPEDGREGWNVLPKTQFRESTKAAGEAREQGGAGMLGYRLTPYTQSAADFVFIKSMMSARPDLNSILRQYAQQVLPGARFVADRDRLLTGLWHLEEGAHKHKAAAIHSASRQFGGLKGPFPTGFIQALQESTEVFSQLIAAAQKTSDTDLLADILWPVMADRKFFQAYTFDQVWKPTRSKTFIKPRLEWWLEYIRAQGLL